MPVAQSLWRILIVSLLASSLTACVVETDGEIGETSDTSVGNGTDTSNGGQPDGTSGSDGGTSGPVVEHTENVESSTTWSGTHIIEKNITITGTVTIEKCTKVEMKPNKKVNVKDGGSFVAKGTKDCPVKFTSSQSTPAPGDWRRIDVKNSANNNMSFEHTVFEYGGAKAKWGMMWVESGTRISFSNVTFRNSGGRGAYFENSLDLRKFKGVAFANVEDEALRVAADTVGSLDPVEAGKDVAPILVQGGKVEEQQTWKNLGLPLELSKNVQFQAQVDVEAGTELRMGPNVKHNVKKGGSIRLLGSSGSPVVVRSAKSSPAAGDWRRFDIRSSSGSNNLFRNAEIKHGGAKAKWGVVWLEKNATLKLENTTFSKNQGCDIYDEGTVNASKTNYKSCTK